MFALFKFIVVSLQLKGCGNAPTLIRTAYLDRARSLTYVSEYPRDNGRTIIARMKNVPLTTY